MTDPTPRRLLPRLFVLLGLGAVMAALTAGRAADPTPAPPGKKPPLFADWPKDAKPEAVLVLSGQSYGYLQPCGCARPQLGGLERRAVFIEGLKAKGWAVAGVDLGDLFPEHSAVREQGRLKYIAAMNALRDMGYVAVGVGKTDLQAGLDMLLGAYAVQEERPPFTLAGNAVGLDGAGKPIPRPQRFPAAPKDTRPLVGSTEVVAVGSVPVGVAGVVGTPLALQSRKEKWDPSIDFGKPQDALTEAVKELAQHAKRPQLNVLIFQGSAADAAKVAADFPAFHVILCQASDSLAPLQPQAVKTKAGTTLVVEVGTKGQNVGVVGAFKKPGGGLELKYQLVPLGEEYVTPGTDEQALKSNAALRALDGYAQDVKRFVSLSDDYRRVSHPAQVLAGQLNPKVALRYVGSEACKGCHAAEHAVWAKTPHGHALDTLEKYAKRPNHRQFDGECVKCHSVGFDYESGFKDAEKTPHLKHVGCENCHGPGSGHAADPKNPKLTELLSPWKQGLVPDPGKALKLPDNAFMAKMEKLGLEERGKVAIPPTEHRLVNLIGGVCMRCHDLDADPKFDLYRSWPKISHAGLAPPGGWPAVAPQPKK